MQSSPPSRHPWLPLLLAVAVLALGRSPAAPAHAQGGSSAASSVDKNPLGWCCPKNPKGNSAYSFQCSQKLLDDCLDKTAQPLFHGGDQEALCNENCGYPPADPDYAAVCGDGTREPDKGEECEIDFDSGEETGATCAAQYGSDFPHCDPATCLCVSEEPSCGNERLDEGEECDLSFTPADGAPEQCYRGGGEPSGTCRKDCTCDYDQPVCGDGEVTGAEECDFSLCKIEGQGSSIDGEYYIDASYTEADCIAEGGFVSADNSCPDIRHVCDVSAYATEAPEGASCVCRATAYCGDGVRGYDEYGWPEECDDGNVIDGDGCSNSCEAEGCGNGVLEWYEECDDGNVANGDGCDYRCAVEACGNGVVDEGEECDDGNAEGGDDCSAYCTLPFCGDGDIDPGEQCDDGAMCVGGLFGGRYTGWQGDDGSFLSVEDCEAGGGIVLLPEGGDGCGPSCRREECGNYVVEPDSWWGEACDDGGDCWRDRCVGGLFDGEAVPDVTAEDCALGGGEIEYEHLLAITSPSDYAACVDPDGAYNGYAWGSIREDAQPPDTCDEHCLITTCGDGFIDTANGEECDGGGGSSFGCSDTCKITVCGNRHVDGGEECDGGSYCWCYGDAGCESDGMDGYYLTSNADLQSCVDVGGTPEVDDSNHCSAACTLKFCGDAEVNGAEECDDGAYCDVLDAYIPGEVSYEDCAFFGGTAVPEAGDGCDAFCYAEICGNGFIDEGEECDVGYCVGGNYDGFYINTYKGGDTTVEDGYTLISYERCADGGGDAYPGGVLGCDESCRTLVPATCGNGRQDDGEECDEGSECVDADGEWLFTITGVELFSECKAAGGVPTPTGSPTCTAACRHVVCGNGTVEGGEECDEGSYCQCHGDVGCESAGMDGYYLTSNADLQSCIDAGGDAEADDSGDCSPACTLRACGDAEVEGTEECDDGGVCILPDGGLLDGVEVTTPGLVEACLLSSGDAFVVPVAGDGCDASCAEEMCGNAVVDGGEDCDAPALEVYCDYDGDGSENFLIASPAGYESCRSLVQEWLGDEAVLGAGAMASYLVTVPTAECNAKCRAPTGGSGRWVYCCEGAATDWDFKKLSECGSRIIGGQTYDEESTSSAASSAGAGEADDPSTWNCLASVDEVDGDGNPILPDARCPARPGTWECAVYNEFEDCRSCSSCDGGLTGSCNQEACEVALGGGGAVPLCTYESSLFGLLGRCTANPDNEQCRGDLCALPDAEIASFDGEDCTDPLMLAPATSLWARLLQWLDLGGNVCVKGPKCIDGVLLECATYADDGNCTSCFGDVEGSVYELEQWIGAYAAISPETIVMACPASSRGACDAACSGGSN